MLPTKNQTAIRVAKYDCPAVESAASQLNFGKFRPPRGLTSCSAAAYSISTAPRLDQLSRSCSRISTPLLWLLPRPRLDELHRLTHYYVINTAMVGTGKELTEKKL
mgnify:CR=1 FL=1